MKLAPGILVLGALASCNNPAVMSVRGTGGSTGASGSGMGDGGSGGGARPPDFMIPDGGGYEVGPRPASRWAAAR